MADEFDVSGIDRLIILADAAKDNDDQAFAEAMLAAAGLVVDLEAKLGDRITWGFKYLLDAKVEAIAAIRQFPELDPHDHAAVLACQLKVRDYTRVAGFVDRLLRGASSGTTEPEGDDPSDGEGGFAD